MKRTYRVGIAVSMEIEVDTDLVGYGAELAERRCRRMVMDLGNSGEVRIGDVTSTRRPIAVVAKIGGVEFAEKIPDA